MEAVVAAVAEATTTNPNGGRNTVSERGWLC